MSKSSNYTNFPLRLFGNALWCQYLGNEIRAFGLSGLVSLFREKAQLSLPPFLLMAPIPHKGPKVNAPL
jgi:hypothetical protein